MIRNHFITGALALLLMLGVAVLVQGCSTVCAIPGIGSLPGCPTPTATPAP